MQSFYFRFSEGKLRKIGLFLRYSECIDVQNGLQQSGTFVVKPICAFLKQSGQLVEQGNCKKDQIGSFLY